MIQRENVIQILEEVKPRTLIAATKYGDDSDIATLVELGVTDIGENRVSAFLDKYQILHDLDITWHFIGHLQSKKVKKMINKIDYLHSLDRMSLADEIQKYRKLPLRCFLEVNISKESSKYGLKPDEVIEFCQKIQNYDKIHIVGFMGMAELTEDESIIRQQFQSLVDLKDEINRNTNLDLRFLSMGMSNDYKIALEVGATHLRIGSLLFRNED